MGQDYSTPRKEVQVDESDEFSRLGLKLSFIVSVSNKMEAAGLTTQNVSDKFVKPITAPYQCSFCEYQRSVDESVVGHATVFISHAWRYQYLDVIDALQEYFASTPDVIVWFDLFSNNQHKSPKRSFDWWSNTFKTAIKEFGTAVMVLAPWNNPVPLTRGWCIWELFCIIDTQSAFGVAMSKKSEKQFIEDVQKSVSDVINRFFATIDCKQSACEKIEDKNQIHEAIERTVGFAALNEKIFERMRKWMIEKYETQYNIVRRNNIYTDENHPDLLLFMHNLGCLHAIQGHFDQAKGYLVDCMKRRKVILGKFNQATLRTMNELANVQIGLGNLDAAKSLLIDCYEKRKPTLGSDHIDTLESMHLLGSFYSYQHDYDNATKLLIPCLEKRRAVLGYDHPSTLSTRGAIVDLCCRSHPRPEPLRDIFAVSRLLFGDQRKLLKTNHPDDQILTRAFEYVSPMTLSEESLASQRLMFGDNHPYTLELKFSLASLHSQDGNSDQAEALYKNCLEKLRSIYGLDHRTVLRAIRYLGTFYKQHDEGKSLTQGSKAELFYSATLDEMRTLLGSEHQVTLSIMSELSDVYTDHEKYDQAIDLAAECLATRRRTIDPQHPDTIQSMEFLACLYEEKRRKIQVQSGRGKKATTFNSIVTDPISLSYLQKAEPLLLEAFEARKASLGYRNPDTLTVMRRLANNYCRQGKLDEGKAIFTKLLEESREYYGEDDPFMFPQNVFDEMQAYLNPAKPSKCSIC